MRFHSEAERQVFEVIAPRYEKDGYRFVDPREVPVPSGDWSFFPDFIAQKGDQFVAIEVKLRRSASVERSLQRLKEIIELNKNWRFEVYYADGVIDQKSLPKAGVGEIKEALIEVQSAAKSGFFRAAFLLSWGTFEAAAREAHSRTFARPQTPSRVITVLAENGSLTPDHADRLRQLAEKRNLLVHGTLSVTVEDSDIAFLTESIEQIVASYPDQLRV